MEESYWLSTIVPVRFETPVVEVAMTLTAADNNSSLLDAVESVLNSSDAFSDGPIIALVVEVDRLTTEFR